MPDFNQPGKALALVGLILVVIGGLLILFGKLADWTSEMGGIGWLGRLPGDIWIKRDNFSFYFPITTSIVVSVLLTLVLSVLAWLFRR